MTRAGEPTQIVELSAELPVQPVQHVTLALQVTPGGVSLAWEAGAARGWSRVSPAKSRVLWGCWCFAWRAWVKGW